MDLPQHFWVIRWVFTSWFDFYEKTKRQFALNRCYALRESVMLIKKSSSNEVIHPSEITPRSFLRSGANLFDILPSARGGTSRWEMAQREAFA